MSFLRILLIFLLTGLEWNCPECAEKLSGNPCPECGLPPAPPGMVYIPSATLTVLGETVTINPFYLDTVPVPYRGVLPWLGENCRDPRVLASVITGQYSESGHFLAFSPLVATAAGEYSVPSSVLDRPASGFTWEGASWYLSSRGVRLPTLAEIHAAHSLGLIEPFNTYNEMQLYAGLMQSSLGDVLGALSVQAMFAGYSTADERVMWELTHTPLNEDASAAMPETGNPYVTLFKPLQTPLTSGVARGNGYFNVIFRGALDLPAAE